MSYNRDSGCGTGEASTLRVLFAVAIAAGLIRLLDLLIGAVR